MHGSAPDITGKNIANPGALLLAATMMLRHIGENERAARIESALEAVLRDETHVTRDLDPENGVGTVEMADNIIAHLS